MNMKSDYIFELLLELLFPNRCIFCDELTFPFQNTCDLCLDTLPKISNEICLNCGNDKKYCKCNKSKSNFYEGIFSPFYYEDMVIDCLHRFKFSGNKNYYKVLAAYMYDSFKKMKFDFDFDYITSIPMTDKRLKERSYNQSSLIASELSILLNITYVPDLLKKIYETDSQHLCSKLERHGNLFGAFDVNNNYNINGKNILIIDDIKTSGVTLNECSKMLYLYGASHIYCETAAIVKS